MAGERRRAEQRRRLIAVILLAALVLVIVAALVLPVAAAPAGPAAPTATDDFSVVPDPLPPGQPGDLIRAERLGGPDHPVNDTVPGTVFGVQYHSRSLRGDDIAVTGFVVVPSTPAPSGGRPLVSWAHGTTGVADLCAPSRFPGESRGFSAVVAPLLARGYLVVATDYEGLGTPGRHPYLVGESEARGVIDIVRAARQLPEADAGAQYAVWGHSQGGGAVLWADQIAPTYAPELDLVGSVALAPASHAYALYPLNQATGSTSWGYLVMWLAGIGAARPGADLSRVFTDAGLVKLPVVDDACADVVDDAYRGGDGTTWFRLNPSEDPVFGALMAADEPGQVRTNAPQLVAQGLDDTTVPPGVTKALVDGQCALGQVVRLDEYDGADHSGVVPASLDADLAWTADRFAGIAAPTGCPAVAPPPPPRPPPTLPPAPIGSPDPGSLPAPGAPPDPSASPVGTPTSEATSPGASPAIPVVAQPRFTG